MTMKVLQRKPHPDDFTTVVDCAKCESVLEFAKSDGQITNDQGDRSFISFRCPVCSSSQMLRLDDLEFEYRKHY